jgi:hypothetical protein
LFVCELLRLPDGRACLRQMLARLPENLNWQTAFFYAFAPHFQRLIDVDKWWSLHVVHLTGQGFVSVWTPAEICQQLDEILTTPIEVRLSAQELPLATRVKLQSILIEWDFSRQQLALRQKLNLLQALRLRAPPASAGLVEDYRQTIDAYLRHRGESGGTARRTNTLPNARLIVKETSRHLDELDARLEALRKQTNTPAAQFTISR